MADAAARWLAALALSIEGESREAAKRLFRQMLSSSERVERAAAEGVIALEGDRTWVGQWLAFQVLSTSKRTAGVTAAKTCLTHLLTSQEKGDRRAAEHALLWMVLHTRPARCLSRDQRRALLLAPHEQATDWAALVLDKQVIRPLLQNGRWWHRCRFAQSKFGFDFADEGINFVWERIEKYRPAKGGFEAWLETVLNNYWRSLHRKWKRSVPKHSEIATELDRLVHEDGRRRVSRTPDERTNGAPPPLAPVGPFAATPIPAVLTDADLATLNRWSALDRVLFGLESGVWRQLPPHLWDDWLRRAGINGWESDSPMGALTPAQCRLVVSRMTKIKPATLTKRWQRLRPAIASLPSISRLIASRQEM